MPIASASTLASLIQAKLRDNPDRAETTIAVAGPGGVYHIVHVLFSPDRNEILLDIEKRDARPIRGSTRHA